MLRGELTRSFRNRFFLLAIILGTVSVVVGLYQYTIPFGILGQDVPSHFHPAVVNAYDATIWAYEPLFYLLAPLISTFPFAASYLIDRQTGYLDLVLVRTSFRRYFKAKFISNLLVGGVATALPIVLMFVFAFVFYHRGVPPADSNAVRIAEGPWGPFRALYTQSPNLYIVTLILRTFLFGAAYATLGLAISTVVNNPYLVVATTVFVYFQMEFLLELVGLDRWGPAATLDPLLNRTVTCTTVFAGIGGVLIASTLGLVFLAHRERMYHG